MLAKTGCILKELYTRFPTPALIVAVLTFALMIGNSQAFAATEKVLWSFGAGGDGIGPSGGLVMDASGNFYGTTSGGGNNGIGTEVGVIFKLTTAGQESVLWNFGLGNDGQSPTSGVILDSSGNLYGTTAEGGLYENSDSDAGGTVFKLTTAGQESVLWNFGNGNDGHLAYPGLVVDANGNFFGATAAGGTYGENIIGYGTAFELTPTGQETVLWNFGNGTDGVQPSSKLVMDASGNLYGTTNYGGTFGPPNPPYKGSGVLFKLTPTTAPGSAQTTWTESVLWNFGNGSDGSSPNSVIIDASGNLLGETGGGGAYGGGTVFEVTPEGQESILWSFGNGSDGGAPAGGLIMDASGNLYGTTVNGGAGTGCQGCGTVFELSPPATQGGAWTESVLYNFGAVPDGQFPSSALLMDASGNLYGETGGGGANLSGTVYEISGAIDAASGQIALSAQHLQFPKTAVGAASSVQLAIRNTGKGQLTGSVAAPPAPFGIDGSGSFNLAPHTQTTITLTFNPTAPTRVHRLDPITSNSVKHASINLDLRGIGAAPSLSSVALK